MSDPWKADEPIREENFINESERDSADPSNDEYKVVKLESDGKLGRNFLRNTEVREYTVSGSPHTWTKPDGLTAILVEIWGGGGSGASVQVDAGVNWWHVLGGSGGAYRKFFILANNLDSTETVIVGSGAEAVTSTTDVKRDGKNGEDSSFKGITAKGGFGGIFEFKTSGLGSVDTIPGPSGGSFGEDGGDIRNTAGGGGSFSGRNRDVAGASGASTVNRAGTTPPSNASGGTSILGGNGGACDVRDGNAEAEDGEEKGGGGGAALNTSRSGGTAISGAGGDGYVRITEYF